MSWATSHIERLRAGCSVQFRPHGNSMRGRIESGQRVTVVPEPDREPQVGDVVLCRVHGRDFLHLVKAIRSHGPHRRWLIGNNRGGINGWIPRHAIYGRCVAVED
ncbi:hypothetical protein [Paraliomyxa miuraensis]|uniref:hypothetical protein n=1 Tax=Paraliomyxa miuraensis TaxID=376150 RepID=UPI00225A76FB|nr:hypothetical protein [Paraliomyxa miuraensis]MCX4239366.1 hypothetical protein [Paraliomyxa miuraensis]